MTAGIGHNSGQTLEPGHGFRKFAWQKARVALLPKLPIEIVRRRVKRAQELGLPYKTYAGVRAATGHDLIGFLFSSNALGVTRAGQDMPRDRQDFLAARIDTARLGLLYPGLDHLPQLDACHPAPPTHAPWSAMRDHLKSIARAEGHAADRYLVVGVTGLEREWAEAMQAAGYLTADQIFDANRI